MIEHRDNAQFLHPKLPLVQLSNVQRHRDNAQFLHPKLPLVQLSNVQRLGITGIILFGSVSMTRLQS